MIYLSQHHILHRDLAAKNCLLGNEILKVSDFGLSREMDPNYEYISEANPFLPFRWLPLEALVPAIGQYKTFTVKGDVWSFGVLIWEMFEMGASPYDNLTFEGVKSFLLAKQRLNRPEHCPRKL
uniref:Protein kinase domain-containing protein n=1 Tax=Panagrolaimus superbus TaxID=310955 RepID=A0A914YM72_9BILA